MSRNRIKVKANRVIPVQNDFVEREIPHIKIAVVLVSHEMNPMLFTFSLANMMAYTAFWLEQQMEKMRDPEFPEYLKFSCELGCHMEKGTYVHVGRQQGLIAALADDVTHMLWVDTDMTFPKDSLQRLMAHNKNIVGINYSTRGLPLKYVAIKKVGNDEERGYKCETLPDSTGLEEVEGIGFGMVLIRAAAFKNVDLSDPLFWFEWFPNRKEQMGEDIYFCKKLREAGETIWVDHDLSKECGHVGQVEFKLEHVWEHKQLEAAQKSKLLLNGNGNGHH